MADKHRGNSQLTLDEEAAIITRIQADVPLAQVARDMGITNNTVGRVLRRNHIEYRPPRARALDRAERDTALRMYAAGKSANAIALGFKVKADTIIKVIRDAIAVHVSTLD